MEGIRLYADGGVIQSNPSPVGGQWAWCLVDRNDNVVTCDSGVTLPGDVFDGPITNNQTEFLAALLALEAMPDRWCGELFTDSKVTWFRLQIWKKKRTPGLPDDLLVRLKEAKGRLGEVYFGKLAGHPREADLRRGHKRGVAVSIHHVWCDQECNRQAKAFLRKNPHLRRKFQRA